MKSQAIKIISRLEDEGYEAYFIGGSVRNKLHTLKHNIELPIKDYDIVTNAPCEKVLELFEDTEERGVHFKVAIVRLGGYEFEIAQYRGESYPEGGSLRPNEVYSVETLEEDLQRRDFTINGIAMTKDNVIIDPLNGVKDIENKIIKTIGKPYDRFSEDPLRIIRAFRFMSQLDYQLDTRTQSEIKKCLNMLNIIPHERIKEEIHKIFRGVAVKKTLRTMKNLKVHKHSFTNSITNKQVYLLPGFFGLSYELFSKALIDLEQAKGELDLAEIYYALYMNVQYDIAEKDIKESMFLNEKQTEKILLILRHKNVVHEQDYNGIYALVRDIGEQRGLLYLKEIIQAYTKFNNISIGNINSSLERKVFKYQLDIDGNDILKYGMTLNLKPGKWIGEVLDRAQLMSIRGEEYSLEILMKEVLDNETN